MTDEPHRQVRARTRVHPCDQRRDLTELFGLDRDALDAVRPEVDIEAHDEALDDLFDAYDRSIENAIFGFKRFKRDRCDLLAEWMTRWQRDGRVRWIIWHDLMVEVYRCCPEHKWRFDVSADHGARLHTEAGYASARAAMIAALDPTAGLIRARRGEER